MDKAEHQLWVAHQLRQQPATLAPKCAKSTWEADYYHESDHLLAQMARLRRKLAHEMDGPHTTCCTCFSPLPKSFLNVITIRDCHYCTPPSSSVEEHAPAILHSPVPYLGNNFHGHFCHTCRSPKEGEWADLEGEGKRNTSSAPPGNYFTAVDLSCQCLHP